MVRFTDDVIDGLREKLAQAVDRRDQVVDIDADELREVISHMEGLLAEVREQRK